MIINTSEGQQAIEDSASIRRTALRKKIFCTTTMFGAFALVEAIASDEKEYEQKALYYARNRVELKKIKELLHSKKKDSSLSNPKEYISDLEKNYSEIVSKMD